MNSLAAICAILCLALPSSADEFTHLSGAGSDPKVDVGTFAPVPEPSTPLLLSLVMAPLLLRRSRRR